MPIPQWTSVDGQIKKPNQIDRESEETRIVELPDGTEAEVPISASPNDVMNAYRKKVSKYPWSPQAMKERFVKPEKATPMVERVLTPAQERAKNTVNVNDEPASTGVGALLEKMAVGVDQGMDAISNIYTKGVIPEDKKRPLDMGAEIDRLTRDPVRQRELAAETAYAQEYWPQEKIKAEWLKSRQTPVPGSPEWAAVKSEARDKLYGVLSALNAPFEISSGTVSNLVAQSKDKQQGGRMDFLKAVADATNGWFIHTEQAIRGEFAEDVPPPPYPGTVYYEAITGEKPDEYTGLFMDVFFDTGLLPLQTMRKFPKMVTAYGARRAVEKAINEAERAAGPAIAIRKKADAMDKAKEAFLLKSKELTAGAAERFAPKPLTPEEIIEREFQRESILRTNVELERQAKIADLNQDHEIAAALRADKKPLMEPSQTLTGAKARPVIEEQPALAPAEMVYTKDKPPSVDQILDDRDFAIRRQIINDNPALLTKDEAARIAAGGEPPSRSELIAREQRIVDQEMERRKTAQIANEIPRQAPLPRETVSGLYRKDPIVAPETNRAALAEEMREDDFISLNSRDRQAHTTHQALEQGRDVSVATTPIPQQPIDATQNLFIQRDRFQGGRNRKGFVAPGALAAASTVAGAPLAIERDEQGKVTGVNPWALAAIGIGGPLAIVVGKRIKLNLGLDDARRLKQMGMSNDEIKKATGWSESVDRPDEWKIRISDKGAQPRPVPVVATSPERVAVNVANRSAKLPATSFVKTTLAESLDHPTLYKLYPYLAQSPVMLIDKDVWPTFIRQLRLPDKTKGFYRAAPSAKISDTEIYLPATNKNGQLTIESTGKGLHEAQHAIQKLENFERSKASNFDQTSPETFWKDHDASTGEREAIGVERRFNRLQERGFVSPGAASLATGVIGAGAAQGADNDNSRAVLYAIAAGAVGAVALPKMLRKPAAKRLAKELVGNPEMAMIAKSIGNEPTKPGFVARILKWGEEKVIDRVAALEKLPKEGKLGISGATMKARTMGGRVGYMLQSTFDEIADPNIGVGNKTVQKNKDLFAMDVKAARDIDRYVNRAERLGSTADEFDNKTAIAETAQRDYEQALKDWAVARHALNRGAITAADYENSYKNANAAAKRRDAALRDLKKVDKKGNDLNRPVNQKIINPATNVAEEITADVARKAQQQIAKTLKQRGYDYAEFERARKNWKRITDQRLLQVIEDSGFITHERAREIRSGNDFYATYEYLDLAASDDLISPVKGAPEQIFGSDLGPVIRNPIGATLGKMEHAYWAIGRNAVMQEIVKPEVIKSYPGIHRIADDAEELKRLQEAGMPVVSAEQARLYSRQNLAPIAVYENGKRNRYLIPKDIFDAIQNISTRHLAQRVPKIISATSTMLRETATTLNIPFAIANVFRDAGLAYLSSPVYGMSPTNVVKFAVDWFSGFGAALKHELGFQSAVDDYLKHGGGFGPAGWMREETDKFAKMMPAGWRKVSNLVLSPAHLIRGVTEASELATRTGVFKRALKMGFTMDEAAFLARCATVDFGAGGTALKQLNMWIPFLNARVQGTVTLAKAFKRNPGLFMAKLIQGTILPAAAATAWNIATDPEGYYQIDSKLREDYFVILLGRGKDDNGRDAPKALYIPKGTQGKLWNPFQHAIDKKWNEDPRKTWGSQVVSLVEAVMPVEFTDQDGKFSPTKVMAGLLPPLATAIGQAAVNRKFYWDMPIDSPFEVSGPGYKPPEMRFTKNTPEFYKDAGEYLGVSPKQLQAFAQALVSGYSNPVEAFAATTGRFYRVEGSEHERQAIKIVQDLEKAQATAKRYAEQSYLNGSKKWREPMITHNQEMAATIKRLGMFIKDKKMVANIRKHYLITSNEMENIAARMKKKQRNDGLGYLESRFQ